MTKFKDEHVILAFGFSKEVPEEMYYEVLPIFDTEEVKREYIKQFKTEEPKFSVQKGMFYMEVLFSKKEKYFYEHNDNRSMQGFWDSLMGFVYVEISTLIEKKYKNLKICRFYSEPEF